MAWISRSMAIQFRQASGSQESDESLIARGPNGATPRACSVNWRYPRRYAVAEIPPSMNSELPCNTGFQQCSHDHEQSLRVGAAGPDLIIRQLVALSCRFPHPVGQRPRACASRAGRPARRRARRGTSV